MSKNSDAVTKWRTNTKEKMVAAMGGKCQCCGYNKCNRALAFHHIDPAQKDISFSYSTANPIKWETLVEELKKCILVCNNCHSEIHAGVRDLPETFDKFNEEAAKLSNSNEALTDKCPNCDNKKSITSKFCSHKCAMTNRRKVDWDSIDVIELLRQHGVTKLSDMLGISTAAIYKRRDKILKK